MSDPNRPTQAYPTQPVPPVRGGQPTLPTEPLPPAYPHGPYAGPPYAIPVVPMAPVPPARGPRPPLTVGATVSSMIAGALGFTIMAVGFALGLVALLVLFFGAFTQQIIRIASQEDGGDESVRVFNQIWDAGWWVALVAAGIGLVVWLVGFFVSYGILKLGGNRNAAGITWAGLGIAIVATWALWGVASMVGSLTAWSSDDLGTSFEAALGTGLVISLLVAAAIVVASGLFSWWWMAYAMRRRDDRRGGA